MEYSLLYRITAKVQSAVEGFKRVQSSFGNVGEKVGIMGRKMEKTLTLQKLGWLGFAYMVGKSVRDIMLKSTILQTFIGTWAKMFGALLDVILAPLIPVFMWLTGTFMKLFKLFQNLPKPAKDVIAVLFAIAGAFATFVGAIMFVLPVLKAVTGILGFVGIKAAVLGAGLAIKGFLVAIGPVGWAIIGIIAAVAILAYAWNKNWGGIQEKTKAVVEWFKSHDWALLFIPIIGWQLWLVEKMCENWDEIKNITIKSWDKITEILEKSWSLLTTIAEKTWKTINVTIAASFLLIRAVLMSDTEFFKKVWSKFGEQIITTWSGIWNKAKEIFARAATNLINKTFITKNQIIAHFKDLPDKIKRIFRDAPQKIAESFRTLPQKIVDTIGNIGQFLWNKIKSSLSWLDNKIFSWAKGELGLSPPLKQIGRFLKNTLEKSFLKNTIRIMPNINDSALFKSLSMTNLKAKTFLKNIETDLEFGEKSVSHGGSVTIDKRSYNVPITVEITTEMKEEGKSSEEIANDVATILSEKLKEMI